MLLKQWDKAGETYDALIKLKPNDAAAHLNSASSLSTRRRWRMRRRTSQGARAEESWSIGALLSGLIMISTKRYSEAVT
jgi:hypothetical protein